jgi:hypothetical protein
MMLPLTASKLRQQQQLRVLMLCSQPVGATAQVNSTAIEGVAPGLPASAADPAAA